MTGKMLTPEQVAERLAVTPNTVRGWLRNGMLKGVKLGNKVWRVREEALEAYICHEHSVEYGVNDQEEELGEDDLKAIRRGLEDIRAGRFVAWEDYQKGKPS
ncbi:MAG: helix-turn-helix domain-containing protein [Bacillota bacterium]|nr:helix-turn-helix domain-containing protein [Bacillota bacterium]